MRICLHSLVRSPADVVMIHDDFKVPLSVLNLLKQEKGVLAFCG